MKRNITNISLLRKSNIKNILNIVWKNKVVTRKELSNITSITAPTISNIIDILLEKGFIKIKGKGESTGERQPDLIEFNPTSYFVIGISLKVYKVQAFITDLYGNKVQEFEVNSDYTGKHANILPQLEIVLENLINKFDKKSKLVGIGVSFPGTIDNKSGIVLNSPIVGNGIGVNIKEYLERRFNLPTFCENNANLCTLNEYWFGKGKNKKYVLFVFAGFGIGNGIVIDGEIYTGYKDAAGEIGHTVIEINGKKCYCGSYGCLETVASYPALFEQFQKGVKMGAKTNFKDIVERGFSVHEVEEIFRYAEKGDKLAISVIENIGRYIGIAIANLVNILNPEIVIIGGDYYKVKNLIGESIKETARLRSWPINKETEIVFTDFGLDACVYGAATLAIKKFLDYRYDYFIK